MLVLTRILIIALKCVHLTGRNDYRVTHKETAEYA